MSKELIGDAQRHRALQELLDEPLKQRPAHLEDRSDTSLLKNT